MKARITLVVTMSNICGPEDLVTVTFEEMVRFLLQEEGLAGVVDQNLGVNGDYDILEIEQL